MKFKNISKSEKRASLPSQMLVKITLIVNRDGRTDFGALRTPYSLYSVHMKLVVLRTNATRMEPCQLSTISGSTSTCKYFLYTISVEI